MVSSTGFDSASARYIRTRMVSNIHRPFFRNVVQISLRNDLSFGGYRLVNRIGNEEQLVKMFLVGFTAFLLPQICGVMASGIRLMCSALRNNIHP